MSSTPPEDSWLPTPEAVIADLTIPLTPLGDDGSAQALVQENHALREQIAKQVQLMHLLTHQLATPLTSLGGSIQLLSEPDLSSAHRQEFLAVVQQQVHRLQALLHDLMALRNLETGNLETHPTHFCIQQLVQEVAATFRSGPISYHFSPDLPMIWADRWQVSQILTNLISNAIKYSADGAAIEIGATPLTPDWLEIWVRDHGLGIPQEAQAHLFERFYRVKHRDRQSIDGTGLGLSLCKLLVENQGGQINFESTHGEGSRFYFALPTHSV